MKENKCTKEACFRTVDGRPAYLFVCDTQHEEECVYYAKDTTCCHFRESSYRVCNCEEAISEAALTHELDAL